MGLESFTYNGINSIEHGVYLTQRTVWGAPRRSTTMIQVAGRSGDLTIDNKKYENVIVRYTGKCVAQNKYEFAEKLKAFRNELCASVGYKRLTDTYNPDEYRLGVLNSDFNVEAQFNNTAGTFEMEFNCKPQRFLVSGELEVALTGSNPTISNPTIFNSKPLIKITGVGTLSIGDWILTITGTSSQTLYIYCEMMEVYKNTGGIIEGANGLVTINKNEFPELVSGVNNISVGSGLSNLVITPRWWRL